jgi:hypothetical protein
MTDDNMDFGGLWPPEAEQLLSQLAELVDAPGLEAAQTWQDVQNLAGDAWARLGEATSGGGASGDGWDNDAVLTRLGAYLEARGLTEDAARFLEGLMQLEEREAEEYFARPLPQDGEGVERVP